MLARGVCIPARRDKMKPSTVTVDNLPTAVHEQYARGLEIYDRAFVTESPLVSPHVNMAVTSTTYASQCDALFETHIKNQSWAHFSPPPEFTKARNRFFSVSILPSSREHEESIELVMQAPKARNQDPMLFERDRSAIVNLLETADSLTQILQQIKAFMLQYRKG